MNSIVTSGVKTDSAFFMEIIYRIIEQIFTVITFFGLYYTVEVYFYEAGCPKSVNQYAFTLHPDAEMQHKTHNDRDGNNAKTHNRQNISFILGIGKEVE